VGGCGYKALLVINGTADVYVFATAGTKKWDTCAPEAIIKAAGGTLTDMKGVPINYSPVGDVNNLNGIVASLENHERYIQLLNVQ